MKVNLNGLALGQIDKRLDAIREVKAKTFVKDGWIKYIRKALGLTLNELAGLVGISPRTLAQSEKREIEGKVTLSTLKKLANAMECELVYSFVPQKSIVQIIRDKALEKARTRLAEAGLHMELEAQKVHGDMEERVERLAQKFIEKGEVW